MKSRIEKSIDAKMKKIQAYLDAKLNQMMNAIQLRAKTINEAGKQDPPVCGVGYEPVPSRRSI